MTLGKVKKRKRRGKEPKTPRREVEKGSQERGT
jgi:hypothetical protein